jgi:hypothetical protein
MKVRLYDIAHGFPLESLDIDCPGFIPCGCEKGACRISVNSKTPHEFFCMTKAHVEKFEGRK